MPGPALWGGQQEDAASTGVSRVCSLSPWAETNGMVQSCTAFRGGPDAVGVNASALSAEQQSHCSRPALSRSRDRLGSAINSRPQRALMSGTGCCITAVLVGSSGWSQARQVSGLLTTLKTALCHPPGLSQSRLLAAGAWACCSRRLPVTLPWPAHFSCPRWVLLQGAVLFPTAERWESSQRHKLSFSAACEGE